MKDKRPQLFALLTFLLLTACGKQPDAFVSDLPAPFAEAALRAEGACSVDLIQGGPAGPVTPVSKVERLHVVGWGAIPRTTSIAQALLVELAAAGRKSLYYAVAKDGIKRPDVAKALREPAYQNAGFELSSGLGAVPAGTYDVNVVLFDGSAGLVCFGLKKIQVK